MSKLRCGLIGNPLGHSWSPEIHAILGDYDYTLWPMEEDAVAPFLQARDFDAINVTIPYKKTVMPHLDRIADDARRIGSVNTIVKEADGSEVSDDRIIDLLEVRTIYIEKVIM